MHMEIPNGKFAWMVKIGEKGQFVIPKEARELFEIQPGDTLLLLGDLKRGIAIPPKSTLSNWSNLMFRGADDSEQEEEE